MIVKKKKKQIQCGLALSVCAEWVHNNISNPVMTLIFVDKRTDHAKPH